MSQPSMGKIAAASFVGAMMEWYDFFIFGTASALVFGPLFFPGDDPATGVIASFATFGVGFLARPLGGIVFGHLATGSDASPVWSRRWSSSGWARS